jgi:type IV pilus biogenesis protein PilP
MTDTFSQEPQPPVPSEPKPNSPVVVFLTSSTGRLIIGGILLFVVIVVAGTFAFFFLVNAGNNGGVPVAPAPGAGSQPTTAVVVPTNPPEQPLEDTFTFRNVFAPTVKPPAEVVASSESSETSSATSTNGPEDTLILKSIQVEDGVQKATFEWNGAEYTVAEGDTVDSSPWKVLEISSDSVVMLFGDSRVTLTVGQGFSGAEPTK